MKEIKAIIQPFMLPKVIDALKEIPNMPGVTISEIKGFGRGRAENSSVSTNEWGVVVVSKVKLEAVVRDEMMEEVVSTIQRHAHTGKVGDGKIFIYEVIDVVRIRTAERGSGAL